ncbi:tetratricopeptide repeat protein [Fimbriiglobus ruber]|uniref:Tetratricopeptide repeat protein n=1 Tax=Fimbriiglobus ruber TaxID=1908690 RepID=A0A225DDL2_9BACT|nr:hypothetical protein [Fimbriiglobus ruber]OWK34495.1 hypothetical protein FRUB_10466 [Fimbriiglobus ruber]
MIGPSRYATLLACAFTATAFPTAVTPADAPPGPTAPGKQTASTPDDLVRDLGSAAFPVRERATKELWKLGEAARPALTAGLKSGDAEVAQRAREILDKFDAGVFPDTPPEVLKQIREFRGGTAETQQAVVTALIRLGDPGVAALQKLLAKDVPAENREQLFEHLDLLLRTEVPKVLFEDKVNRAEALLALNAFGPSTTGLLDYATFLHLRGRAKAVTTELDARRKEGGERGDAAANALVFVARAAGNYPLARTVAKELNAGGKLAHLPQSTNSLPPNVYESLLESTGAWSELADGDHGQANSPDGVKIFHLRAAGRTKEADELLDEQKDASSSPFAGSGIDPATLALLANDRPLDAIERMQTLRTTPHLLADLLAARLDFSAALALAPMGKKLEEASGPDIESTRALYDARRGQMLGRLGKRDAAAQLFARVADRAATLNQGSGGQVVKQLVRAEVRSGRYDLACEHFAAAVVRDETNHQRGIPSISSSQLSGYEMLFDADADAAQFWWRVLRKKKPADETVGATMKRVRGLLAGTATKAEFDHALACAGRESSRDINGAMAVAGAFRAAGRLDDAAAELSRFADLPNQAQMEGDDSPNPIGSGARAWVFGTDERFRFWLELGDLLVEQGKFKDAAARYESGWRKYPSNPLLLYFSGRALLKAGEEKEGRRRTELAHWVALGNARLRGRFLEELITRGFAADARRECELIRESGWLCESHLGNVWNQVARASVMFKDFPGAIAANRRAIHYILRTPGVSYVEGHAYLVVPQLANAFAAREALAAGRVDEAVAKAKACLVVTPGNVELVTGVVPELDKIGRKKDADELFRTAWTAHTKLLVDNPDSPWVRYAAAWLAAGCGRELDTALEYAKKAVELDPVPRSYKEALAEVLFRRGDRPAAVAMMKELVTADRRSHYYKRQVERYQTAGFDSPLPEGDDD